MDWEDISRWLAGIVGTITMGFLFAVRWWVGDRFNKMDDRIKTIEDADHNRDERMNSHDISIAVIKQSSAQSAAERKQIIEKLDRIWLHQLNGTK